MFHVSVLHVKGKLVTVLDSDKEPSLWRKSAYGTFPVAGDYREALERHLFFHQEIGGQRVLTNEHWVKKPDGFVPVA